MPNNAALGAGAGFFQGFNSIFTPYLIQQAQQQQQQQFATKAALKKQLSDIIATQMDHGLFDESDPDAQDALKFVYSGDANMKEPKNLATYMAGARMRLQSMEDKVPQAMDALTGASSPPTQPSPNSPVAPPAQAAPAPGAPVPSASPEAAATPADPTAGNMYGDAVAGPDGRFNALAPAAQPQAQPTAQPAAAQLEATTAPAPEPLVFGNTIEDRAALNVARKQLGGVTTTIRHKSGSVTFPGLSVTDREKLTAGKALRDAMNDVPLEEALKNVTNPTLLKGIKQAVGSEQLRRMTKAGIPLNDAVKSIAALQGIDAVPKQAWDYVTGPELAAAKAAATTPAMIDRANQMTDVLVNRENKLRPGKVETARQTAEETAPIKVDTAEQIAENNRRLANEYSLDEKVLAAKELGIDVSQPLNGEDSALLLQVLSRRKRAAANNKLQDKLDITEKYKDENASVAPKDLQTYYDPETGKPAAIILRNTMPGEKITPKRLREIGAVSIDKEGVNILRSAQKTNTILKQYLDAANKVFTSESPSANFGNVYKKWLTANPDYQDLVSEKGKLATMIRALGEKGALAEGDVERGMDALLMGRNAVSHSQIVQSVREINEIIQTGIDGLGFNAAKIVPNPQQQAPTRLPVEE